MHPDIAAVLAGERRWCVVTADCLDVLPTLPAGCVDAVVTDPPFGINYTTGFSPLCTWTDSPIACDEDTSARDWVLQWAKGLPVACFGSWKAPRPQGVRGVLAWDKGPAFGMGDLSFPWKPSWEEIYIFGHGWEGRRDEGVLRGHIVVSWESRGRTHPNEKPVSLIVELLRKLPHANVILDPFCGTGATGKACLKLGRRFIGIEISLDYAALARARLERAEADDRDSLFPAAPVLRQTTLDDVLED